MNKVSFGVFWQKISDYCVLGDTVFNQFNSILLPLYTLICANLDAEDIRAQSPTTPLSTEAMETLGDTVSASRTNPARLRGVGSLLPVWRDIATLVCPLLHSLALDLEFRVSILLKGPKGCGRRTASEGAASALGLNFIMFDCSELEVGPFCLSWKPT